MQPIYKNAKTCAQMPDDSLSWFTHMTIAIAVLLVEAAADLSLVSPIMLGIFLASIASKLVNHHAYDEVV